MKKIKLSDNVVNFIEGRTNGISFVFAKKVEDEYHAINKISTCKDFLNDVVWSEKYNKPSSVYGHIHPGNTSLFTDKYAYLLVEIKDHKQEKTLLENNYKNIMYNIRLVEKKLGVTTFTKILKTNQEGYYLIRFSTDFCKQPYMISFYTFLIRLFLHCDNLLFKNYTELQNYFSNKNSYKIIKDVAFAYSLKKIITFLFTPDIINKNLFNDSHDIAKLYPVDKETGIHLVHNYGFLKRLKKIKCSN